RPIVTEKAATSAGIGAPPPRATASQAIVADGWKLIRNLARDAGKPEFELFDRRADPLDQRDVASGHPDVVQKLAAALDGGSAQAGAAGGAAETAARELRPEERERLRSLGYVQ